MDKKTQQAVTVVVAVIFLTVLFLAMLLRAVQQRDRPAPAPPDDQPDARPKDHDQPAPPAGPETPPPTDPVDDNVHLTMGNPSRGTEDEANPDNYLMRKPYFALSYNNTKGGPNWVAWCLRADDFGTAPRVAFFPDPSLPSGFTRIFPKDYQSGGFDRGHLCQHSDRASTPAASRSTFVMTNMIPQSPHLNQKGWNDFEEYCRGMVRGGKQALYIVAGPQGTGGEGMNGRAESLANGKINVPAKCWKVALAVENGTGGADDVPRVGASSQVIAVVMPNDQSVGHGWAKYRTSVAEVEALTGYTFFDRLPKAIIDPLKQKVDDERIPASRPTRTAD